ncbi:NUDIX hydrolase [Frankia sp. CcI156]|uniref:NUDIX hydrolase n=1 Tax=Frankia casuarinae (strain DSM 45818 / CECT 9043 / HFP020203 / CcI3) TaxID=106370 RepID=Q2J5V9_FRACC|nr:MULTISPECIES: NUDIX domain-containing protein [Frankia]ABD13333.1 NUDIX hydrolase [Frankia casuarinae]ETA03793.1 ADP-ribose pyrophosphatase [Frankia sp. CcI6]EYT93856.1 ADP-ribose pyrophosphatase [Frankia casuarinae]KDA44500.1 ADP-ribose pyrophosphatase [Frankia sp. BMG5.23]OAA20691.1 ADP-ribose pyrophosphatase [Frankia casuarinae]
MTPLASKPTATTSYGDPVAGPVRINARALLVAGDRVLLANERGQKSFHLPGGRVEPGETVQAALRRLLNEQAGIELDYLTFVGGIESISIERGGRTGVLDVVFAADRSWGADFGSRLNDLDIVSVSLGSLLDLELRPADLRRLVPAWLTNTRPAWYGSASR